MQKDLKFRVASIAKDAYDVDDVIRSLPKDLLSIDDETGVINGVEEAFNEVRKNKPYLFDVKKNSGMSNGRPTDMLPEEKSPEQKINEDPKGILRDVLKDLV